MMPGGRNKQDKLYQEWSRHSGLPEDAIPHPEPEARTENGQALPSGNTMLGRMGVPNALTGLGVGRLPDSLLIIILLGLSVILSIVNMMMLVIVLLKL
jgi:hypothetical protein